MFVCRIKYVRICPQMRIFFILTVHYCPCLLIKLSNRNIGWSVDLYLSKYRKVAFFKSHSSHSTWRTLHCTNRLPLHRSIPQRFRELKTCTHAIIRPFARRNIAYALCRSLRRSWQWEYWRMTRCQLQTLVCCSVLPRIPNHTWVYLADWLFWSCSVLYILCR